MIILLYFLIIIAAAVVLITVWSELMRMAGHLERNYRGRNIPQSMGVVFPLVFLVSALWAGGMNLLPTSMLYRVFILSGGLGFLGFLDDIWGDSKIKGFGGHFKQLIRKGKITTGFLKALIGLLVSMLAVYGLTGNIFVVVWRAIIVALSANLLNLLDLRPGRSLKGFFLLAFVFIALVPADEGILLLFPFLLTALALFSRDLNGTAMMGDTGSNVLGGILGFMAAVYAPVLIQFVYFALLAGIHLLTEKISLTKLIAHNPFLRSLDRLGRTGWEK